MSQGERPSRRDIDTSGAAEDQLPQDAPAPASDDSEKTLPASGNNQIDAVLRFLRWHPFTEFYLFVRNNQRKPAYANLSDLVIWARSVPLTALGVLCVLLDLLLMLGIILAVGTVALILVSNALNLDYSHFPGSLFGYAPDANSN